MDSCLRSDDSLGGGGDDLKASILIGKRSLCGGRDAPVELAFEHPIEIALGKDDEP